MFSFNKPFADVSSAESVVELRWQRDIEEMGRKRHVAHDDLKYATGDGVIHVSEGDQVKERETMGRGCFVELDREGINTLIRNLRRACDEPAIRRSAGTSNPRRAVTYARST